MNEKRIRYCTTIFILDKNQTFSISLWDKDDYQEFLKEVNKHYGLHLISENKELSITIEYSNIIWNYKVFYGSCKKKFKPLLIDDERWLTIEKQIFEDLKRMGLEVIYDKVIEHLKRKEYFEYNKKSNLQFKKYCI